jgi:hypothetical protein
LNSEVQVAVTARIGTGDERDQALFNAVSRGATEFLAETLIERARQCLLWGERNERTLHEWCGILGEEKGEVDRACNEIVFGGEPEAVENLLIELVQVAATSMAVFQAVKNGLADAAAVAAPLVPVNPSHRPDGERCLDAECNRNKPVILLCGPVGSGKDSVAKHMIQKYGFVKGSFARPLKQLCAEQFGWDLAQLDDLDYKEEFVPELNATRRQILQRVGTEWFRAVDPQHWTKKAVESIREQLAGSARGVVVSDLRFVNEAATVRAAFADRLVLVIAVTREDGHAATSGAGHSSELEWTQVDANAEISAPFGQLPLLYERADQVLALVDILPPVR